MKTKGEIDLIKEQISIADMLNDSSIDRVMAIDLSWNIIAWNKTSEDISGIQKSTVIGKNLLDIFPQIMNDQEMLDAIHAAFEGNKSFLPSNNTSFNRKYSENHFIPLLNKGKVMGVMNIMHDVSHRMKAEKQLEKLNQELEKKYHQLEKANNELATFTYITSHDIKEPLKHVYTSLELLVKNEASALTNMSKGNLRRMQGSLNKMNLLLDDILTVSGITSNKERYEMIELDEVLKNSISLLRDKLLENRGIINADRLPAITGYKKMLDYFFLNMIDNALKFHAEDTIPIINIASEQITGINSGIKELVPGKTYLKISFSDNGIGFDQSDSERIFRLFERLHDRKYHGSGIGLTICNKIVEAHDGYIQAMSSPNNGATFNCYFPLDPQE